MHTRTIATLTIAFALGACNQSAPPDSDEQDSVSGNDSNNTDLPNHEDLSCDNECPLFEEGTDYEVGACRDGQCGPIWYWEFYGPADAHIPETQPPPRTCEEVCSGQSALCVAEGCSGKTGFICRHMNGEGCDEHARLNWTGACGDTVPWPHFDFGASPILACCCQ